MLEVPSSHRVTVIITSAVAANTIKYRLSLLDIGGNFDTSFPHFFYPFFVTYFVLLAFLTLASMRWVYRHLVLLHSLHVYRFGLRKL